MFLKLCDLIFTLEIPWSYFPLLLVEILVFSKESFVL